jgi:membrane fusion protein (multidrug efflux system)
MKKRMFLMLLVVIVFIGAIGGLKFFQIRAAMSQRYTPPPEAVTTVVAKGDTWTGSLNAIGSVASINGVTISADLPGVVTEIDIDSGRAVEKDAVLIRQDTRQEVAQLAATEAQQELTRLAFVRNKDLLAKGIVPQSTFDQAEADYRSAVANVGNIRATIARKTIRAPFSGLLGIRQVSLGQYLASAAPIVTLETIRPIYVNFSVPQQELGHFPIGSAILVTGNALGAPESGKITAFDSAIDETTRNVRVQSTFDNRSGRLRAGMYVDASLARGNSLPVILVPVSAISYAPFGDSVFIVENMKGPDGKFYLGVRQQFVKLGGSRGDQVAVLTGLKAGEQVVTSGAFKLRPGAAVIVNNSVQPENLASPKPENS